MSIGRGPYRSPGRRPIRDSIRFTAARRSAGSSVVAPFTARFRKRGWSVTCTGSVS